MSYLFSSSKTTFLVLTLYELSVQMPPLYFNHLDQVSEINLQKFLVKSNISPFRLLL